MKHKQIDGDATDSALAAIAPVDEVEEALALWRRRFDAAPRDDREKARQLRFQLSRGYSHSIAFKVLKAAEAGVDDPAP